MNKISSLLKPFLKYGLIEPIKDDEQYVKIMKQVLEYAKNYPFLSLKEYYTMMKYSRMLEYYDKK